MTSPFFERSLGDRLVRAWVTDRASGSVHPDRVDPETLRRRQVDATGSAWAMTDQVHGTDVVDADVVTLPAWAPTVGRGDVLVTRRDGVAISVWAADCAPLVLAADDGTLVAAHGGWRGLAAGVVDVAVDAATANGGSIGFALLGPVIHPCCYEFGETELLDVAHGLGVTPASVRGRTAAGAPSLDVPGAVAAALRRHGVRLDHRGPCTGCDDRWFSHRVRGDVGRHALVVARETR